MCLEAPSIAGVSKWCVLIESCFWPQLWPPFSVHVELRQSLSSALHNVRCTLSQGLVGLLCAMRACHAGQAWERVSVGVFGDIPGS